MMMINSTSITGEIVKEQASISDDHERPQGRIAAASQLGSGTRHPGPNVVTTPPPHTLH
jgi:hypothetical protein